MLFDPFVKNSNISVGSNVSQIGKIEKKTFTGFCPTNLVTVSEIFH